uniref:SHSP domain-containing protein n=1 Tax=Plectus sambesii TaxID=2011161 RepID=A0A914WUN7_9BILA
MAFYRNIHHNQWDNRWDSPAPERLYDQFYREPLTGPRHPAVMFRHPMSMDPYYMHPVRCIDAYVAEELGTGFSDVHNDAKQFAVRLDVSRFKPEEVTVCTTGNTLLVKGEHQEELDAHGYTQRSFVRKYPLPGECNLKQIESQLSRDGVLTVSVPKVAIEGKPEHLIPNEEKKDKVNKLQAMMSGH